MNNVLRTTCASLLVAGAVPLAAEAAITPLDSALFTKKFEMNGGPANLFGSDEETDEWTIAAGGNYTASQGSGQLNYATSGALGSALYWDSDTFGSVVSHATGATFEISVRVNSSSDSDMTKNRAIQIVLGDEHALTALTIGTDKAIMGNAEFATGDNTDGYHVFRVARDANTDFYSLYRDGVNLANDLGTIGGPLDDLYFGDGTGGWNGDVSVDYFRWTAGGYSPVPEPAGLALLIPAIGALCRRRK